MISKTKTKQLYIGCFLLAFCLRIGLIFLTPEKNEMIDLLIYRDAGQLVVNGVNPYDFTDDVELRNKLRTDKDCYNEFTSATQESWNIYANSNLPLATLFFGAVEYLFSSSLAYRLIFAFFDSLLAVIILAFVLNKWRSKFSKTSLLNKIPEQFQKRFSILIGLLLGAVSPVLLLYGTVNPEPKGMAMLLILSAIYFSDSPKKVYRLLLSPVLLGCSVAFFGLGAFIAPLCLYNIYSSYNLKTLIIYCAIAFVFFIIWLIPFLPELFTMMSGRLSSSNSYPQHGSMWVMFYDLSRHNWILIRNTSAFIFVSVNIIGIIKKRINITIIAASLLFFFTILYLVDGSMDRLNIAVVIVIILLGISGFFNTAFLISVLYLVYGCFAFIYAMITKHIIEEPGRIFILLFFIIYMLFLIHQTFKLKKTVNET